MRGQGGLGGFNYGFGSDDKCGLKYIFGWGVKQHISIWEYRGGIYYEGWVCKYMGLFNLLVKLNCTDK